MKSILKICKILAITISLPVKTERTPDQQTSEHDPTVRARNLARSNGAVEKDVSCIEYTEKREMLD